MNHSNEQAVSIVDGSITEQQDAVKLEEPTDIGSVSDTQMLEIDHDTKTLKDLSEDQPALAQQPHTSTKDRTLQEFLGMMDQYAPIVCHLCSPKQLELTGKIPDAVTDYYLSLAGFDCEDARVKRLLALATQKFVADIAQDAYQYSKIRAAGGNPPGVSVPTQPRGRFSKDRGRAVLTMDDLGSAVHEYGINLKRQDFMR